MAATTGSLQETQGGTGSRSFEATDGTVTITSTSPTTVGTFAFHAGRVYLWPTNPTPGTTVSATPAFLTVAGNFTAPRL